MPTITSEIDIYSALIPKATNSIRLVTCQRIRVENTFTPDLNQGIGSIGVHLLDTYPTDQTPLSLSQEYPVSQDFFVDTTELKVDWVGIKYLTFVYEVNNLGSGTDLLYYPIKIEGTDGNTDISNPVVTQNGNEVDAICNEDGDVTFCVDATGEVIFVLKDEDTGIEQEVNGFVDDLITQEGADYVVTKVGNENCIILPIDSIGENCTIKVVSNDDATNDIICDGCIDAELLISVTDYVDGKDCLEIELSLAEAGNGAIYPGFLKQDAYAFNTPFLYKIDGSNLFYYNVEFESSNGCIYTRALGAWFGSAKIEGSVVLIDRGTTIAVQYLMHKLISGLSYTINFNVNGQSFSDTKVAAEGLFPLGVLPIEIGTVPASSSYDVTGLTVTVNGETCSLDSIENNNLPLEGSNTIGFTVDALACATDLIQSFNICVDPQDETLPSYAPINDVCELATNINVNNFEPTQVLGDFDNTTLSVPVGITNDADITSDTWYSIQDPNSPSLGFRITITNEDGGAVTAQFFQGDCSGFTSETRILSSNIAPFDRIIVPTSAISGNTLYFRILEINNASHEYSVTVDPYNTTCELAESLDVSVLSNNSQPLTLALQPATGGIVNDIDFTGDMWYRLENNQGTPLTFDVIHSNTTTDPVAYQLYDINAPCGSLTNPVRYDDPTQISTSVTLNPGDFVYLRIVQLNGLSTGSIVIIQP